MIKVKVEGITKVFHNKNGNNGNGCVEALGGINLEVRTGEFPLDRWPERLREINIP